MRGGAAAEAIWLPGDAPLMPLEIHHEDTKDTRKGNHGATALTELHGELLSVVGYLDRARDIGGEMQ